MLLEDVGHGDPTCLLQMLSVEAMLCTLVQSCAVDNIHLWMVKRNGHKRVLACMYPQTHGKYHRPAQQCHLCCMIPVAESASYKPLELLSQHIRTQDAIHVPLRGATCCRLPAMP